MNSVRLVYTIFPCLVGAYAAAVFLTTRSISAKAAWSLALLVASALTIGALIAMRPRYSPATSTASIVESYVALYFIPAIVLVGAAVVLRSRDTARGVGIIAIVALFLASTWFAEQMSARLMNFVNAVQ